MKVALRRVRDWMRRLQRRGHRLRWRLSDQSTLTAFMYHRVTDEATRGWGPWQYAVTPETFETHIATIASEYEVVTLDDVLAVINDERDDLPARAAVVTFDDGYEDNRTEALPVLERYGVPATIYVNSGLLGSTAGPFEFQLANALRQRDPRIVTVPDLGIGLPDTVSGSPEWAFEKLRRPAKWEPPAVQRKILAAVRERPDGERVDVPATPMLTEAAVADLCEHPLVTVGAHAHEHVPLTTLSEQELRTDIETVATRLADVLGARPVHFSYPFGAVDETVQEAVVAAGFETAVTATPAVTPGPVLAARQYALPRFDGAIDPP